MATKLCSLGAVCDIIRHANFGDERWQGVGFWGFFVVRGRHYKQSRTTLRVCDIHHVCWVRQLWLELGTFCENFHKKFTSSWELSWWFDV